MATHVGAFVGFAVGAMVGPAFSCEQVYSTDPLEWAREDKRLSLRSDCSFENPSFGMMETGNAVFDRGNMRIAQKLAVSEACAQTEQLLFVDCSTGDLVVLEGTMGPDLVSVGGASFTSIKYIQKPLGPINVTSESTVADLIETAKAHGIDYYTDFVARQKKEKRKNRYDAYCGCKIYYPDSVGAQFQKP